jgi:hypothetical protein
MSKFLYSSPRFSIADTADILLPGNIKEIASRLTPHALRAITSAKELGMSQGFLP